MRHIALFDAHSGPCNGQITFVKAPPKELPKESEKQRRSLPILSSQTSPQPDVAPGEWLCEKCGKRWSREPLPEEAL